MPLILVSNNDRFEFLGDSTLTVGAASRSSVVAQAARSNQALIFADQADTAVLDRQLLRRLNADEAILSSFGQPQESTKGGEHQGLGLKIVTDLCQEMGIDLEVLRTDRGTQFRLELALDDENT